MVLFDKDRESDKPVDQSEADSGEPALGSAAGDFTARLWDSSEQWEATIPTGKETMLERRALRRIRLGWLAAAANGLLSWVQSSAALWGADGRPLFETVSPGDFLPGVILFLLAIGVYSRILVSALGLLFLSAVDLGLTFFAGPVAEAEPVLLWWMAIQGLFLLLFLGAVSGIMLYRRLHPPPVKRTEVGLTALLQRQLPLTFAILAVAAGAYVWGTHLRAAARGGGGASVVRRPSVGSASAGRGASASSSRGGSSRVGSSSPASRSGGSGGGGGGGGGGAPPALTRKADREGLLFGADTDSKGCVAEGLRRHEACKTAECYSANGVFLSACLGKSSPSPGFCEGIPDRANRLASAAWRAQACSGVGRGNDYCEALLEGVQHHCRSSRDTGS